MAQKTKNQTEKALRMPYNHLIAKHFKQVRSCLNLTMPYYIIVAKIELAFEHMHKL